MQYAKSYIFYGINIYIYTRTDRHAETDTHGRKGDWLRGRRVVVLPYTTYRLILLGIELGVRTTDN